VSRQRGEGTGHTALTAACAAGHLDVVKWLVSVGSDPRRERKKVACVALAVHVARERFLLKLSSLS
jgi:hypothetical protein